jgi:hypothetical protein
MPDYSKHKLGKLPVKHDDRTLLFARYTDKALPTPPASADSTKGVKAWGMMLNDSLGDCTCAACGHAVQVWSLDASKEVTVPDSAILKEYEGACGYDPKDPSTDQGGVELDVLNYFRKTGIGGHKITAYAALTPKNQTQAKEGISLFGLIYVGANLPLAAQTQKVWDVPASGKLTGKYKPGSWGGHAFVIVGYDASGLTIITWGELVKVTWAWYAAYVEEAYAIVSPDFIAANGEAPCGFNLAQLQADLAAVTSAK